jgi:hypothetical protein
LRPLFVETVDEVERCHVGIATHYEVPALVADIDAECGPFQPHYRAFIPDTSCSVPVLRIGTLVLAVLAA